MPDPATVIAVLGWGQPDTWWLPLVGAAVLSVFVAALRRRRQVRKSKLVHKRRRSWPENQTAWKLELGSVSGATSLTAETSTDRAEAEGKGSDDLGERAGHVAASLEVVDPAGGKHRLTLRREVISIGGGPQASVRLDDPDLDPVHVLVSGDIARPQVTTFEAGSGRPASRALALGETFEFGRSSLSVVALTPSVASSPGLVPRLLARAANRFFSSGTTPLMVETGADPVERLPRDIISQRNEARAVADDRRIILAEGKGSDDRGEPAGHVAASLEVVDPAGGKHRLTLRREVISIGSGPQASVRLDDPDLDPVHVLVSGDIARPQVTTFEAGSGRPASRALALGETFEFGRSSLSVVAGNAVGRGNFIQRQGAQR